MDRPPPDDRPFHFSEDLAATVGREPAGTGQLGPSFGPATPGRAVTPAAEGIGTPADQEGPVGPELREFRDGITTDGAVIYVPEKPGIWHGQLLLNLQGAVLPVNIVDPRGGPWIDGESNRYVSALLDAFRASNDLWLELRNPIDGQTLRLAHFAAHHVATVQTVRAVIADPPVPEQTAGGVKVVRTGPGLQEWPFERRGRG